MFSQFSVKLAIQRANQDYVVPASTSQDALPSPLALLAATCSKIGAPSEEGGGGNQQSGVSTPVRVVGNGNFNGSGEGLVTGGSAPAWVQLPAGGGLTVEGVKSTTGNASSAIQTSGGQILQQPQLIAQSGPGGTLTYTVVPPSFQTLSIDGQEAIFIPSSLSGNQSFLGNQAIISAPNGQFVRAPAPTPSTPNLLSNVAAFGNLGNMVNIGGNWINIGSLQNNQRPGMIQTLQVPLQQQVQQIPNIIQIPISNGQGGHTLQTIQLPLQSLGTNAYQPGQFQGAIALPTGTTLANGQTQTQLSQQFVAGTQAQQIQIQQQNAIAQATGEAADQSAVVMSTGTETIKAEATGNNNSQSNTQVSAVNQVMVSHQQSDSPASSQPQQTTSQSQATTTFANQSQAFSTLMPLSTNFINSPATQALFTGSQSANSNAQNVLSFAIASVPQATATTTTTTSSNSTAQQMTAQNIISPQLLQSLGAQGFGNLQMTSNGQIIATPNPAFMPSINVANIRQPGQAGMTAVQLQNMQGLQGLALPTLQNLQNLQAVQTLGGGAQLIGGAALQNFGVTLANAGNSAQLSQLSPQQIQMQAMGTQQAALQQTQQALNQAVLNATALSGHQITTIQDPTDPTKWQLVQTPTSQSTPSSVSPTQVTMNQSMGSETGTPTGRRLRREACTCPNCRDSDGRTGDNKKKQHICHIPNCNKVYGKTSHLRAHLRWHTGERPFVCSWLFCGKRFTRSDELQRHTRTHTGEKKFQCTECSKKFMRSDHLSKHQKTHQIKKASHLEVSVSAEEDDSLNDSNLAMDQDGEMPDDVTIITNSS